MGRWLAQQAEWHAVATVTGRLYRISDYPALVAGACDGEACVQGDIYRLHFPSAILSRLDAYEGIRSCDDDEYERRLLPVVLADGAFVAAWVYCYRKSVDVLEWMESGDWLSSLNCQHDQKR